MKIARICLVLIGVVGSKGPAVTEPLVEGRVLLPSGAPVAGAQVRLFDLTDLRAAIGEAKADESGYFSLSTGALLGLALPEGYNLGANYPNPFNPSTIIPYELPAPMHVQLEVFNILGQQITTLVDKEQPAGFHTAHWDATDASGEAVAAGVYLYRLSSDRVQTTRSMLLIDGQAGISSGGTGGSPGLGGLVAAGETTPVYGLTVSGPGFIPYVDPAFGVEVGRAPLVLVVGIPDPPPRAKVVSGDDILGDVDNNGQVDFVDALLVAVYSLDHSVVLPNNGDISLGDVDGDGQVKHSDAGLISAYFNDSSDPELPPGIGEPVVVKSPDLILELAAVSDSSLTPGQSFTFSATLRNQGTGAAESTTLRWYRSTDATISAQDTEVGTDQVDILAASGTHVKLINLTAPSSVGTYYYGACVVSVGGESAGNNCSRGVRVRVESESPDLVVESLAVSDSNLTVGHAFSLTATVRNQGTAAAPSTFISWYRSANATIDTRDTLVVSRRMGPLAASEARAESRSLTASWNEGTYYYGACVVSVAGEADTRNNCSTGVRVIVEPDEVLVFTDPQTYNDNVFVLPVTESLVVDGAPSALPLRDYTRRFYRHFKDEFDFLLLAKNLIYGVDVDGISCARYLSVKNDVQGIGKPLYSEAQRWGSSGKLQGVVTFEYVGNQSIPEWVPIGRGPGLHEFMHRWANSVLPTVDVSHWGFSSANGILGGFDITNLVDHGGNQYTAGEFNTNGSHGRPFSPIELYLAGLISAEEVPDLWVAEDGEWVRDSEGGILRASDGHKLFTASQIKTYTIEEIISEHGPRVPDASRSQRDFRAAVILLIDEKHPVSRRVLEQLSDDISWTSHAAFTEEGDRTSGGPLWFTNFYESTGGRATIAMEDMSHFQRRASGKRLAPSSFGTPPPAIVDRRE